MVPKKGKKPGRLSLDFSEVDQFEVIPAGAFAFMIKSAEVREGENAPYIAWELEITAPSEFAGRRLWTNSSLGKKSLWSLLPMLQNLEAMDEDFDLENDEFEFDYDEETGVIIEPELEGLIGIAVVSIEMYKSKPQSRVDDVLHISEMSDSEFGPYDSADWPDASSEEEDDDDVEEDSDDEDTPKKKKTGSKRSSNKKRSLK